jgi:hypothetical protein
MKVLRVLFLAIALLVLLVGSVAAAAPGQVAEVDYGFTPELIAAVVGAVLSLAFSYFPVLRIKYAALPAESKSGIMIGMNVLAVLGMCFLDYFEVFDFGLLFDKGGIARIIMTFIAAMVANQTTYLASPQKLDVQSVKYDRDTYSAV